MQQDDLLLVFKALHFAADKHRLQRRKDADSSPYINHPIAVAEMLCRVGQVRDPYTLAAGILHDTIEDTETTPAELEREFGPEIRAIVEEVTDDTSLPPERRKQLQVEHAPHKSPRAKLVKLADKICNVRDIVAAPPADWTLARKQKYIDWARAVVAGMRGSNEALEAYFDHLCEQALAELQK
jgi:guanosine-3',5'-bis(diphosphate) 3'-pyrophosphohydrolase